jgi:hypothetical protein
VGHLLARSIEYSIFFGKLHEFFVQPIFSLNGMCFAHNTGWEFLINFHGFLLDEDELGGGKGNGESDGKYSRISQRF